VPAGGLCPAGGCSEAQRDSVCWSPASGTPRGPGLDGSCAINLCAQAAVCFCWVLFQRAGAARGVTEMFGTTSSGSSSAAGAAWALPLLWHRAAGLRNRLVLVLGMLCHQGKPSGAALCLVRGQSGPCSSPDPPLSHMVPIIRRTHQSRLTRSFTGVARITIHTLTKVGKMISWLSVKQHPASAVPGRGEVVGAADV